VSACQQLDRVSFTLFGHLHFLQAIRRAHSVQVLLSSSASVLPGPVPGPIPDATTHVYLGSVAVHGAAQARWMQLENAAAASGRDQLHYRCPRGGTRGTVRAASLTGMCLMRSTQSRTNVVPARAEAAARRSSIKATEDEVADGSGRLGAGGA